MAKQQIFNQSTSFENVKSKIETIFPKDIPVSTLARMLRVHPHTIKERAKENHMPLTYRGRSPILERGPALKLAEQHRPALDNWQSVSELATQTGVDRKRIVYLLSGGRIPGQKDLVDTWRMRKEDIPEIKEINDAIETGIVTIGGIKFYSIAKAAREAAAKLATKDPESFRTARYRLAKRFEHQCRFLKMGQIRFENRYYVPESAYVRMVDLSTLGKGSRIDANKAKPVTITKSTKPKPVASEQKPKPHRSTAPQSAAPASTKLVPGSPEYNRLIVPKPLPQIQILKGHDEVVKEPAPAKPVRKMENYNIPLLYNPENPPSLKQCPPGRKIDYYRRRGVIEKQLKDAFRPQIRVRFFQVGDDENSHLNLAVRND